MKRAKRTIIIIGLALASCRGPVYSPTATPQVLSVRIMATTTAYPLLQDFATSFEQPDAQLSVNSQAANWDAIYSQMQAGTVPYALTSYLPGDVPLWVAPVGFDALVMMVHPTVTVPALTLSDLRNIFQGRVTRWSEVGGPDLPITVVAREVGADTHLVFRQLVMGERRTTLAARLALSGQSVADLVAATPGAIGYTGLGELDARVRPVPLALAPGAPPVLPDWDTVVNGQYPLRMSVQVVGLEPPAPESVYRDWFAWMQGPEGQALMRARFATLPAS